MKLLIAQACQIAGEITSTHADIGDTVDVPKDDAATLTRMGRAFYLDKADDPTKGQLTASAEDKAAVKRAAQAQADLLKERDAAAAATSPAGLGALIAAAIQQAVSGAQAGAVAKSAA